MQPSEECTESDGSDFEETNMVNVAQDSINSFEINNAYSKLVENTLSEMKEKCSPSLLLPAITIKRSEEITGTVHIKNNNETEPVPVNVYVALRNCLHL